MKQKTLTRLSVATALGFLTPLPGYAFGLGQITLYSALNEPFKAEISVNALRDDERGNLEVKLASIEDFERAGLERSFLLTQLTFEVVEEANSTRIMVSSDVPIKEPFLGFLLAATTGQGKLLREYTVLLDPPKELYGNRVASRPSTNDSTMPAPSQSRSQTTSTASSRQNLTEYKVHSRDTLWSIAERTRPNSNISMQQMMIGLLNANPQAFQQNNVNSLYADSTLRIPTTDEITRLSASEAKSEVDRQNAAWKNRNAPQITPVVQTTTDDTDTTDNSTVTDSGTEAPGVNDGEVPSTENDIAASDEESARLKLIAATENSLLEADPDVTGDPDLQRISEQLTLAQETIEAQSQENIDFKNRMDAMERQLDTMRRLISLKDADMARLQSLLEQDETQIDLATLVDEANAILEGSEADSEAVDATLETEAAEVADTTDESEAWEPVPIDSTDSAEADEENDETIASDEFSAQQADNETLSETTLAEQTELSDTENPDNAELESVTAEVNAAIDDAAQVLDIDQQQMDSLYQRVQAFVIAHKIESLLAVLLLLLILWMIIRRNQREVSWDDAVSKINHKKSAKTTPEVGSVNVITPVVEDSNAPAESNTKPTKTKSVDELVEQADMFVGYADYVQAGSALEQAHQQAPEDKDIAAKLMFVYYKQQKSADFIAVLNTSGIDETDPQWPEIRAWGSQLLPHNPLFAEQIESVEETDLTETEEVDFNEEDESALENNDESSAQAEQPDHIEFNLDDYQVDSTKTRQAEEVYQRDDEDLLQFDTNYQSEEKDLESIETQLETENFAEDDDLRIDLEEDNVLQPDSSAPEVLDLDIDESEDDSVSFTSTSDDKSPTIDSLSADELDISGFDVESDSLEKTDDVFEDYLNLDSSMDDDELDFDLSDFDSIDEAETKLDLAAAYSDMGDPEGARGILEEVLEQGTDDQKRRAQELLDSLS